MILTRTEIQVYGLLSYIHRSCGFSNRIDRIDYKLRCLEQERW
jgi:hypothetical protein